MYNKNNYYRIFQHQGSLGMLNPKEPYSKGGVIRTATDCEGDLPVTVFRL